MPSPDHDPTRGPRAPARVSVVIPCFRAARWIRDAVDSVLAQDGASFEVLVVNDGSPDADALHEAVPPHPAVRILDEPHRGLPGARNAGIREARGEVLAFLDADDCWRADFLRSQLDFLDREGADLVYADAEFFGGTPKDGRTVMEWDPSEGPATFEAVLAGRCVPVMSTILARADAVGGVGGFDERLPYAEDFDLWVRMLAAGSSFAYRRDVVARRRLHDSNMSRNTVGMALGQVGVIDRHLALLRPAHPARPAARNRRRTLVRALHLAEAREALDARDARRARRALQEAVRAGGSLKHRLGALALTLAPGLALPVLRRRME